MWKSIRYILTVVASSLFALLIILGVYMLWYFHRPQPTPIVDQILFEGITYTRDVRQQPRPLVIHIAKIDLTNPNIAFLVTPRDDKDGYEYAARTVSEFITTFDVQLAINGDFFSPWYAYTPLHYYPHRGDGVDVRGTASTKGNFITDGYEAGSDHTLFISEQNEVAIQAEYEQLHHAISGNHILIEQTQIPAHSLDNQAYAADLHPRTAVGIANNGDTLLFIVVDGRQPNYSEGVSLPELAQIAQDYGAHDALNLDGGGSSTMAIQEQDGSVRVLNSPLHTRIPGRERPIANHLGVYLKDEQ